MRRMLTAISVLACSAGTVYGSDDSLTIGGVRLNLGMDRSKAWQVLKDHKVNCLGSGKGTAECDWVVSQGDPKKANFVIFGSVYFSNDRINILMKNYDQKQWGGNPEKFVSFLYEVLRKHGAGGVPLTASVAEVREPGWTAKNIFFRSGKTVISVGYAEGGRDDNGQPYRPFISMYEKLQ